MGGCTTLAEEELIELLAGSSLPASDPTLATDDILPSSTAVDYEDSSFDPEIFPDPSVYDTLISAGSCNESDRPGDSNVGLWPGRCPYDIEGLDGSQTSSVFHVDAAAVG